MGCWTGPSGRYFRKGKNHYVCDARLMKRLQTANLDRKNPLAKAALLSMRDHLDLDLAPHLSSYDRERICVPQTCDCGKMRLPLPPLHGCVCLRPVCDPCL